MGMYSYVCVAGTFDGLHKGHEALLAKALESGRRVLIGLTSDEYVRTNKKGAAPYSDRLSALTAWLTAHDPSGKATVIAIHDPYEPAVSAHDLEALVVSGETHRRGGELNGRRVKAGLKPLDLIVVPMVTAHDNRPISATRMRHGDIDREGNLVMPQSMREGLSQPFGPVLSTTRAQHESFKKRAGAFIIAVGDLTAKTLLDAGVRPRLMVIDHHVERKDFPDLDPLISRYGFPVIRVSSGPGYISKEAIDRIREALHRHTEPVVIEVEGEEDLLTLPVVAEAPIGSIVYYGQPKVSAWACGPTVSGIVEVTVSDEQKHAVNGMLASFVR